MAHIRVNGNVPGPQQATAAAALAARRRDQSRLDYENHLANLGGPLKVGVSPSPDKFSTTNLSYPLNVEGDPQQGHYISFYIRVTDKAKLEAFKIARNNLSQLEWLKFQDRNFQSSDAELIENYSYTPPTVSGNPDSGGIKSNSIRVQWQPTVRLKTAISLYMPPSVQVSYESKYGDQEIGVLAETGYQALKAFTSGADTKDAVMGILEGAGLGIKKLALAAIETAAPGSKALFAIDRGKIITPKMELMFEGIGRRNFSFSFVFIPKSKPEADMVHNIVWNFKYHMAADYVGGGSSGQREMSFPDLFDIEYMHIGKGNPNLNKIATCALTKMDVEYGGDRYVAYEDGVPQTTKLSLSFTEMEIITKDHIAQGF